MGLNFHYEFQAPASTSAADPERFLLKVRQEAKALGFDPTMVLNVPFDTSERRAFSQQLGGSITKDAERLVPEHDFVLVVTDARGAETCFGFLRFPAGTGIDKWVSRGFVNSPALRYREIVGRFAAAGYANSVSDEFAKPER